jgi:preprotein translocase subunit SecB
MSAVAPPETPVFTIEKIYVKDLSLEVPSAPQVFLQGGEPQLEVQLNHKAESIDGVLYDVALSVTVTAKNADKVLFLVETVQSGIFQLRGIPESDLPPLLGIVCPNVLFPYARETISDVVTRAGFPPVLLAPVNFEAMFQQQMNAAGSVPAPSGDGPKIEIAH